MVDFFSHYYPLLVLVKPRQIAVENTTAQGLQLHTITRSGAIQHCFPRVYARICWVFVTNVFCYQSFWRVKSICGQRTNRGEPVCSASEHAHSVAFGKRSVTSRLRFFLLRFNSKHTFFSGCRASVGFVMCVIFCASAATTTQTQPAPSPLSSAQFESAVVRIFSTSRQPDLYRP